MKTPSLKTLLPRMQGFTLVEVVIVIVITGILGAMVAVFIKKPVDSYFDSARRSALTDIADTAARRMSRDISKALPNSIRTPTTQCIEFIPTKTGGRYRAETDSTGAGDILDFTVADTSFDMLGANSTLPDQTIATGDVIAVYNLGAGINDAYVGNNTSTVSAIGAGSLANEIKISIGSKLFPLASGSSRFHVIPNAEKVVAYVCSGGKLYRTASNTFVSACPINGAIMANNVSSCNFVYNSSDLQRNALAQLTVKFTDSDETVSLYHEVHVNNTP
ncbi:MAG: prepilin-type N-terminal cleavage/methylation domain-containing protein [Methylotenera sp.]|nr:prepilin-type N-terminal cleavage/methylation domain-containing protein [Methylotenera sp.]